MDRRTFLMASAGAIAVLPPSTRARAGSATAMTAAEFRAARRFADTPFGRIAYVERGRGPAALFLHGLPLNGFQWRGVMAACETERRCVAPDFLGLGYTETRPDQDLAPVTQTAMIAAFLDALAIDAVDVVANDSGGAVAQLLAATHPARVRTLLLTNCDVHTNSPPKAMAPELEAARKGTLADVLARHVADKAFARSAEGIGGACFTSREHPSDEAIDCYFAPLVATPVRRAQLHAYLLAFEPNPLPAIEPALKRCLAPARMVWGTGDKYFGVEWADWLDRTLPASRGVKRVEGAKLFFPEEMPELIAAEARALWRASRR